jgi:DNA-binding NtrC family response regulator
MYRLLAVDDEPNILSALKRELSAEGYVVDVYSTATDALRNAQKVQYDLVISDYRMPEMDGVAFLAEFKARQPQAVRLIFSGHSDFGALLGAINEAEIFRFIAKPWHGDELKATLMQALAHQALLLENQRLADLVRNQQIQLEQQNHLLAALEAESPGITRVNRDADGSIILHDDSD